MLVVNSRCSVHATVCTLQGGQTALIRAALSGHTSTVQALATLGALLDVQDIVSL